MSAPQIPLALFGAKSVEITSEADLKALKVALTGSSEEREARFGFPVDTLVIDSVDELQRLLLTARLEEARRIETTGEDWSWISNRLNRIYTGISSLELNLISVSRLTTVYESPVSKPNIQGSFGSQIHNYVEYAFMLDCLGINIDLTDVEVDLDDNSIHLDYNTPPTRTLVTNPIASAPWVHDDTGTLPPFIDLTFENDFDTIVSSRAGLQVRPSEIMVIKDENDKEVPPPAEENQPEQPEQPEPPVEKKLATGMSSHDEIKAKLLGKRK
ncbi:hypothetical protein EKI60_05945 [Candidatus Saccharibacteria bacterium]|nr:MAG: hypothetical protein EKI60_05945 [Candidatus Saccharibacteria bacterium]